MSDIRVTRWASCILLALALAACGPIKLVSDYDEKLDQGVTDIHKKVEGILTKMERSAANPSATYATPDYTAIKEDLSVLITRADSIEKNELTVKQLYTLGYALLDDPILAPDQLNLGQPRQGLSLQKRQSEATPFRQGELRDLRAILGVNFRSILKLELAKKRGESADSGKK